MYLIPDLIPEEYIAISMIGAVTKAILVTMTINISFNGHNGLDGYNKFFALGQTKKVLLRYKTW